MDDFKNMIGDFKVRNGTRMFSVFLYLFYLELFVFLFYDDFQVIVIALLFFSPFRRNQKTWKTLNFRSRCQLLLSLFDGAT